ncbi:MAG: CsbD family protein [Bacteroidetes bacterium]|nr:MAG: CsbD family protein [Bacteroidota bacterium]
MSAITDKLKGNWNQIKGELKQQYAELTDDDLTYAEGQEDELLGRLQEKLGKTKEEIKDMIDKIGS